MKKQPNQRAIALLRKKLDIPESSCSDEKFLQLIHGTRLLEQANLMIAMEDLSKASSAALEEFKQAFKQFAEACGRLNRFSSKQQEEKK